MPILYNKDENVFNIQTPNTSYVIGVLREKYLLHLYYGKKIKEYKNIESNLPARCEPNIMGRDIENFPYSTGSLPMEYPCYGSADLRTPAFHAEYENGSAITCLEYSSHSIFKGKKNLEGLPAVYTENEDEADTLEITLCDRLTGLEVVLSYTAFSYIDAIAKSVKIINNGNQKINIKSVLSSTTYLFDKNYDFVHLEGTWCRERQIQKRPLMNGTMHIDSKRMASSHHHSPFVGFARPYTTENEGEVYGYSFVYSGNHIEMAEVNQFDLTRINVGINPFGFNWLLMPDEKFQTPEVILTYSDKGFSKMSGIYHKLYRTRLCRGKYRDIERPVLINNWEATYFNFNEDKIVDIAKKAKSVGVELMVLDDGWFGKRNSDNCSLGDWGVNKNKLPNGIEGLANRIVDLGMKFGLWFEQEMVSPDSDLYRAHPDWCIHQTDRNRTQSRNQLILDLSRKEVCDYIVKSVSDILKSAPISYVKWDMNRYVTEIGSAELSAERQQELPHRYILGIYDVLERITTSFPDVLFEGCASGGGRFDAGMLYYYPQYWTSDDSDAIERLYIQHGTSMVMPASAMGAHVSAVPNHQVERMTPLDTRGNVASCGQFGYELDLNELTDEEIEIVKKQIVTYKKIRQTIHKGDMYRLKSPFEGNCAAWEYVSENQVVLMYATTMARAAAELVNVKFCGLNENAEYRNTETNTTYRGDYLMNVGLYFSNAKDFVSTLMIFEKL